MRNKTVILGGGSGVFSPAVKGVRESGFCHEAESMACLRARTESQASNSPQEMMLCYACVHM